MKRLVSASIEEALHTLYRELGPLVKHVLVGGSCGLLLQGVRLDKVPRDLDCYFDTLHARAIYDRLKSYAIDEPEFSATNIYRSELSHYQIAGVTVELVGDFEVQSDGSRYEVRVDEWMAKWSAPALQSGVLMRLTPLAHELTFNVLRDRPDRYFAIAERMRENLSVHRPVWHDVIANNALSDEHVRLIEGLLDGSLQRAQCAGEFAVPEGERRP